MTFVLAFALVAGVVLAHVLGGNVWAALLVSVVLWVVFIVAGRVARRSGGKGNG